jgi:hypothetical protein
MNLGGKIAVIIFGVLPIAFLLYAIGFKSEQIFIAVVVAIFLILFFSKSEDDNPTTKTSKEPSNNKGENLAIDHKVLKAAADSNSDIISVDFGIHVSEDKNKKRVNDLQNRLSELVEISKHTYSAMLELPPDQAETYNLLSNGLDSINIEMMDIQNELKAYGAFNKH